MKILMVNNYHYLRGGSERVMFEEMTMLREHGHEVASFSARHEGNSWSALDRFFPDVPDIGSTSLFRKVLSFPRIIANRYVKESFVQALEAFQPDVVHFHNIYGRLTPVVAEAAAQRGIPAVLTAHDYKLICPSYLRLDAGTPCSACSYGRYGPALLRKCHKGSRLYSILYALESTINVRKGRYDGIFAFLCPSRFLMESLADKGVPRGRLRFVPNFVANVGDANRESVGSDYMLYAGRLSPEKGVETLLRAMQGIDTRLVLVGDGPEAAWLKRRAEAFGISSRVEFRGYCDRQSLLDQIRGSLFVIVPSEWYENAPMAVLEAFALGKPVVGAAIGGIPELIVPGKTGALFTPGDVAAIRAALRDMLSSPARIMQMGREARESVRERFSPSTHIRALLDVYREAMA